MYYVWKLRQNETGFIVSVIFLCCRCNCIKLLVIKTSIVDEINLIIIMHTFPMRAKDNWVLSKNYIIYKWLNISNGYNNIKIKKNIAVIRKPAKKAVTYKETNIFALNSNTCISILDFRNSLYWSFTFILHRVWIIDLRNLLSHQCATTEPYTQPSRQDKKLNMKKPMWTSYGNKSQNSTPKAARRCLAIVRKTPGKTGSSKKLSVLFKRERKLR